MIDQILKNPELLLDVMYDVAEVEILPRFQSLKSNEISEKKPGDLVTIADERAEKLFCRKLPDLVENSVVIGEEGFERDPQSLRQLADKNPVWIVDPVDGTHNFAHGKPVFTVIIALHADNEAQAGWIIDPLKREAVWAVKGVGAWHQHGNAETTRLSNRVYSGAKPRMTAGQKLHDRLKRASRDMSVDMPEIVDRYRCVGREYMDIALGKLDLARYGGILKPWDHAAGCLIVREANGRADSIGTQKPYQAAPDLTSQFIGIAGKKSLWPEFHRLVKRADEYT